MPKAEEREEVLFPYVSIRIKLSRVELSYLLDNVRLVTVYHANLERLREPTDWAFFDINDVLNRQRNFYAVPIIVGAKDNFLKRLNPFLCAGSAVRLKIVDPSVCDNGKIFTFL